jgi:YVTN family beta-propeller protein
MLISMTSVIATIPVGLRPQSVAIGGRSGAVSGHGRVHHGIHAYVANNGDNTVSVINTATNSVTTTIPGSDAAEYVVVSPGGAHAYIGYFHGGVSVVNTATNAVVSTVPAGNVPTGDAAVSPDGARLYLTNANEDTVSVIDLATSAVTATISVGITPDRVAVSPDGSHVYITTLGDRAMSVIDSATNTVTATVTIGESPTGLAVSPDSTRVYVTNAGDNTVTVISVTTEPVYNSHLVGELIGAVDRDGGGWLVIGNKFIPVPPRSPFLSVIAEAAAPHLDQAVESPELGDQIRHSLKARSS